MSADYGGKELPLQLRLEKQQLRNALRQEYWKKLTEPASGPVAHGEFVFDPAHQRYFSMSATRFQYFKPNYWNSFLFFSLVVAPIIGTSWMFKLDRDRKEARLRSGQVAYKDRDYKLV